LDLALSITQICLQYARLSFVSLLQTPEKDLKIQRQLAPFFFSAFALKKKKKNTLSLEKKNKQQKEDN